MDTDIKVEVAKLKAEKVELTNAVGALGSLLFFIFRLLIRYDSKLACSMHEGISSEFAKHKEAGFPYRPYYKEYVEELLKIASETAERPEIH